MKDTSPDAAQKRSAARAKLSHPDPNQPPSFVLHTCVPRFDEKGTIIQPPIEIPPTHAMFGLGPEQRIIERGQAESVEEFAARCIRMMPANRPHFILFYAPEEQPAQA
jgi:hypothetical protein